MLIYSGIKEMICSKYYHPIISNAFKCKIHCMLCANDVAVIVPVGLLCVV